ALAVPAFAVLSLARTRMSNLFFFFSPSGRATKKRAGRGGSMTAKTKKLSALCIAILAAPWGVATLGLTGRASWPHKEKSVGENTDAAYRDGFFWGQLARPVNPRVA